MILVSFIYFISVAVRALVGVEHVRVEIGGEIERGIGRWSWIFGLGRLWRDGDLRLSHLTPTISSMIVINIVQLI